MDQDVYEQLYRLEDGHWWFQGRRAVLWALVRRAGVCDRPRILDAGCGTGRNLVEFGPLGIASGVDPSPEAIAFCHQRGLHGVVQGGLEALPFEREAFDLLLACDVLEHVLDDAGGLSELHRVAAPAARLVITVPAYGWLWSHHDESHHHHRRYTLRLLRSRVLAAGWRVREATYFNSLLLPAIAAARAVSRIRPPADDGPSDYERTPRGLNAGLRAPMLAEAAAIGRGVHFPAGVSVAMVCERV